MSDETYPCANCAAETDNEPQCLCDACLLDDRNAVIEQTVKDLRLSLGELVMTVVDMEDTRDRLNERISATQTRIEATRNAIRILKP